jgi:hypothetical protein
MGLAVAHSHSFTGGFAVPALLYILACLISGHGFALRQRDAWLLVSGFAATIMHLSYGGGCARYLGQLRPALSRPAAWQAQVPDPMRSLLSFLSLTTLGQFCLLFNQLILLPFELHIWNTATAAQWFVVLSTANLIVITDFGLRSSGHADLLKAVEGDPEATRLFRTTWALTRLLVILGTLLFLAYAILVSVAGAPSLLAVLVVTSVSCETLATTRGVWLDTLGQFNRVELAYVTTQASRILLSVIALLGFRAGPISLAWIQFCTAIGWLVVQGTLLRAPLLDFQAGGFRSLRWSSLRDLPFVVIDPASSWIRVHLPVVVFGSFMPAAFIITFVALRAAFGAARLTATQLARYASVQYAHENRSEARQTIAIRAMFGVIVLGVMISSLVLIDDGRLLRLWLGASNVQGSRAIVAYFSVGTLATIYQVPAGILVRSGQIREFAKRQCAYVALGLLAAPLAPLLPAAAPAYLCSLALLEIINAGLFVQILGSEVRRASMKAFVLGVSVLFGLGAVVTCDPGGMFSAATFTGAVWSGLIALLGLGCAAIPLLVSPQAKLRMMLRGLRWQM